MKLGGTRGCMFAPMNPVGGGITGEAVAGISVGWAERASG